MTMSTIVHTTRMDDDDRNLLKPGALAPYTHEIAIKPPRKIVTVIPKARLRPHLDLLFDDAYETLQRELKRLRTKVETGEALTASECGALTKYADALTKLAREERAQLEQDDPVDLEDEEIREQLKQFLEGSK